jgi:DNA-binding transcriptional LysR family regulator
MRPLQIYTAVDAIARAGSIRQAAEQLAISPSALNRQILGLEADLGLEMFDRLPGGVRLSTAGEIYIKAFREHLSELKRVESQLADLSGQRSGTVRIGAGPELSATFLPREVGAYQQDYPLVNFCMETVAYDRLAERVANGELDIGVAVEPVLSPGLIAMATEEIKIVAVSSAQAPDAAPPLMFSDLAQRPLVVPTKSSGLRNSIDAAFAGRRISPHFLIETDAPVTPDLMLDPEALWIVVKRNIDPTSIQNAGLSVWPIAPETFKTITAQIIHREHRTLPVTVNGVLGALTQGLSEPA